MNNLQKAALTVVLLRLPAVCEATGLGKTKIWELIRSGDFPPPVKLTERSRAWRSDFLQAWINNRPQVKQEVSQ